MNLDLIFAAVTGMVVRYKWVETFRLDSYKMFLLNAVALVVGCLSCFFMTMVGNFPVSETISKLLLYTHNIMYK